MISIVCQVGLSSLNWFRADIAMRLLNYVSYIVLLCIALLRLYYFCGEFDEFIYQYSSALLHIQWNNCMNNPEEYG